MDWMYSGSLNLWLILLSSIHLSLNRKTGCVTYVIGFQYSQYWKPIAHVTYPIFRFIFCYNIIFSFISHFNKQFFKFIFWIICFYFCELLSTFRSAVCYSINLMSFSFFWRTSFLTVATISSSIYTKTMLNYSLAYIIQLLHLNPCYSIFSLRNSNKNISLTKKYAKFY